MYKVSSYLFQIIPIISKSNHVTCSAMYSIISISNYSRFTKCQDITVSHNLYQYSTFIWVKVFKNGPSKTCGRQPLKIRSDMVCLSRSYHFKFFKGCLQQTLLGPFLNTLTHFISDQLVLKHLLYKYSWVANSN